MPPREPLAVAVITLDEERNLARCLRSVAWADERLVVDCGSRDRTLEIARQHGATVHVRPWSGLVAQRNLALDLARHEWVLTLDADEWLDAEAAAAVRRALEAPGNAAFALRRRSAFSGALLRWAWGADWQLRLFRRDRGRFAGDRVHEFVRLDPGCRARRLPGTLLQLAYPTLGAHLRKLDRYTDLAAAGLAARGRRFSAWRLVLSPPAAFVKVLILRRGVLDGVRGWLVAAGSAYYTLLKYGKLWELQRAEDPELARLAADDTELQA